jgi:hypothetical protein
VGGSVDTPGTTTLAHTGQPSSGCTEQLARFFPAAEPVQVPAVVTPLRNPSGQVQESVLVEFASAEKAIFSSSLPLEFGDPVRLKRAEGNGETVATVIAVQYHEGRKAVAVEFADGNCSWVKRP